MEYDEGLDRLGCLRHFPLPQARLEYPEAALEDADGAFDGCTGGFVRPVEPPFPLVHRVPEEGRDQPVAVRICTVPKYHTAREWPVPLILEGGPQCACPDHPRIVPRTGPAAAGEVEAIVRAAHHTDINAVKVMAVDISLAEREKEG